MKKKNSTKDTLNLAISAFLVVAYITCSYFFVKWGKTQGELVELLVMSLVFVAFGAILFYATRIGDGVPVVRFSPVTLIVMVIPSLYVVLATMIPVLPLSVALRENQFITYMAAVVFGYGIPYTFLSGFEMACEDEENTEETETEDEENLPEGSIEKEIREAEEFAEEVQEEETDEVVVEGVDAEE